MMCMGVCVNARAVACVGVVCGTGTDGCLRFSCPSRTLSEFGGAVGEVMDVESSGYVLVAWQGAIEDIFLKHYALHRHHRTH